MELSTLLHRVRDYLPEERMPLLEKAYCYAAEAHEGQRRRSGGPYIEHPLHTAYILADLHLDSSTLAAALLHDVPEDCGVPIKEIEKRFGPEIARLVDGVTKLSRIVWHNPEVSSRSRKGLDASESQAENLRKMLVATAEDIRVVLIKLADRLHNMRTLWALSPNKRRTIAQETLEIYAPLAHRLGMAQMQRELEDLSFRYLDTDKYRQVDRLVASGLKAREEYVERVARKLREELAKAALQAEVTGRPKHLYSIYQKMEKYATLGRDFSQIYDLMALRVLVNEVQDCYAALGVVHSLWRPIPGQFDDYIANPKESMYQALHTTVMCLEGKPLEIQIRSYEMHRVAEYGVASHWRYKEGAKTDMHFEEKIAWLRQLMEWHKDLAGALEFIDSLKTDLFRDQVFVFTPKGEIKDLPTGATPLDFAYRIHTDLGHRCVGAKVNGRLVPFDYQLRNGDVVEILASKGERGPSLDWLNPNLGYVHTSHAREKIRQWFKRREKAENVERGRELLDKELKRLGLEVPIEEIASLFKYEKLEDFLAAVGYGAIHTHHIALKLAAQQEAPLVLPEAVSPPSPPSASVQVLGVGDVLTHTARCCSPVPGDEIVGYITRSRGVSVHRKDCSNILHEDEQERFIEVQWGHTAQLYSVPIRIEAWDRVGLLRDISTVVSEDKVNMASVVTTTHEDHTASLLITLETTGIGQLSRILSKLEGVRGVISVSRSLEPAKR